MLEPVKVAIVDSGVDCSLPGLPGPAARRAQLRRRRSVRRHRGARHVHRRRDRGEPRHAGHRRHRVHVAAPRREGREAGRDDPARCGGGGDPLGRRQRRARHQPEPRRRARPRASGPRHVLVARGGSRRVRVREGRLLVAAVGNGDEAFSQPWPFASYPAALPHVIGVSALTRSGNVPDYSNRDLVYNDISAPGLRHLLDVPARRSPRSGRCASNQGYSDCGTDDYRDPEGTSFAAPQVTAAAARALRGRAGADREPGRRRSSSTAPTTSARRRAARAAPSCATRSAAGDGSTSRRRSPASQAPLPAPDHYETNDDAGHAGAHGLGQAREADGVGRLLRGSGRRLPRRARAERAADREGDRRLAGRTGQARALAAGDAERRRAAARRTCAPRSPRRRARRSRCGSPRAAAGWYYVEVKVASPGFGPYTLSLDKTTR